MIFDVIKASKAISNRYERYLKTTFFIADSEYQAILERKLNEEKRFSKGPYLDVISSFEKGQSVEELVNEGTLNPDFLSLSSFKDKEGRYFPLYAHQVEALKKGIDGKNVVVSTGTGSGKTECFLLPILNSLMEEKRAKGKIEPGVRALLIYPMNALANDQTDRLRKTLLDYPDITFGTYTGQTLEEEVKAVAQYRRLNGNRDEEELRNPLPNERLSREKMKSDPPHILITNYAMLEYLLLRPKDSVFFDGKYARSWKTVVMDEAHIYDGASGIEVSMLLRRLKARIGVKNLQFILTSATLGTSEESNPAVAEFASKLTSEEFHEEDIVRAKREQIKPSQLNYRLDPKDYVEIEQEINEGEDDASIISEISKKTNYSSLQQNLGAYLYSFLQKEETFWKVRNLFENEVLSVADACSQLGWTEEEFGAFVQAASMASDHGSKLFDSRYHTFIRATEGLFVTLPPHKDVFLSRETSVAVDGNEYAVFEGLVCAQCHSLYLKGSIVHDPGTGLFYLRQDDSLNPNIETRRAFLVDFDGDPIDEDEEAVVDETDYEVCPYCGAIRRRGELRKRSCGHPDADYVPLKEVKLKQNSKATQIVECPHCHYKNSEGVLRSFFTGQEACTSVLATSLFEELPSTESHYEKKGGDDFFGGGGGIIQTPKARQFLAFSDNRQGAAFFSTYLSETYLNFITGHYLLQCFSDGKELSFDSLASSLSSLLREGNVQLTRDFISGNVNPDRFDHLAKRTIYEALANSNGRNSLCGTGLLRIGLGEHWKIPDVGALHLKGEEIRDILSYCLLTMINDGALADAKFRLSHEEIRSILPSGTPIAYQLDSSGVDPASRIRYKSFLPSALKKGATNARLDYLRKILAAKGFDMEDSSNQQNARKFLQSLWNNFMKTGFGSMPSLLDYNSTQGLYYVSPDVLSFSKPTQWYRCTHCGKVYSFSVGDVCPSFNCNGKLVPTQKPTESHYARTYEELHGQPIRVVEHTAQLSRERAYEYQNLFKDKRLDVLSCSTTFELGVDVGSLETVFMRNVPPSPSNYAQRAGRAGRSKNSAAFALTFCNRANHDFHYFEEPLDMIKGTIEPPEFKIDNKKIGIRHLYSSAFSFFFRAHPEYFSTADDFAGEKISNGYSAFRKYLLSYPKDLKDYLERSLPLSIQDELGVDDFSWIDWLFANEDEKGDYPSVAIAKDKYQDDLARLDGERLSLISNNKLIEADLYRQEIENYQNEDIISFLSRNGVLPKYGFPVDTVELSRRYTKSRYAKAIDGNLDLSRDMAIAISEYAPGSQVIADGEVVESTHVRKLPEQIWRQYDVAECQKCGAFNKVVHSEKMVCSTCGEEIEANKHIVLMPEFGFIATKHHPASLKKPTRGFGSEAHFVGSPDFDDASAFTINGHKVRVATISDGDIFRESRAAYFVCDQCGYGINVADTAAPFAQTFKQKHKDPLGKECPSTDLTKRNLGYSFKTDVAVIDFGKRTGGGDMEYTILQALLLGTARALGTDENMIDGCVGPNNCLVLYDSTPGGSGQVCRLSDPCIMQKAINEAYKVASCDNCGEDTSCYSCLRTYRNQYRHSSIKRGYALEFFGDLIS